MYEISCATVIESATTDTWELLLTPHASVNSKFKRFLDILGSLVGLLILAILFVPIAIAIKIDSPGPIFFTQERYGLTGSISYP
jgi:lipopolysaccharide/colanic/teichoic acid biosynthesis glycosyltransferase